MTFSRGSRKLKGASGLRGSCRRIDPSVCSRRGTREDIVLFADEGRNHHRADPPSLTIARGHHSEAGPPFSHRLTSLHGSLDRLRRRPHAQPGQQLIFTCANHESASIASRTSVNGGCRKKLGLGGREADGQLPAHHQTLHRRSECGSYPSSRPSFAIARGRSAATDSPDQSGRFPSKMVHTAAARLCTPRLAEVRHIQTRAPFMSANSAIVQDLNGLEAHLFSRIKGQDHVIPRVCSVLERGQLGLQPTGKPLGSFLFLGSTGVGKTEIDAGIFPLPVR